MCRGWAVTCAGGRACRAEGAGHLSLKLPAWRYPWPGRALFRLGYATMPCKCERCIQPHCSSCPPWLQRAPTLAGRCAAPCASILQQAAATQTPAWACRARHPKSAMRGRAVSVVAAAVLARCAGQVLGWRWGARCSAGLLACLPGPASPFTCLHLPVLGADAGCCRCMLWQPPLCQRIGSQAAQWARPSAAAAALTQSPSAASATLLGCHARAEKNAQRTEGHAVSADKGHHGPAVAGPDHGPAAAGPPQCQPNRMLGPGLAGWPHGCRRCAPCCFG